MALVAVVVVGVLHTGRLHLMIGKNYSDKIQARYLALAGVEKAKALLYQDAIERRGSAQNHTGQLYDSAQDFKEVALGRGKFSVMRPARADEAGGIVFGIADEESRLNINQATQEELTKINGLTPDIIAAIVDWKDEDNTVSPNGAEAEYYMALRPPYMPRNGLLLTVGELLMVRGISPELLLGVDMNQNGSPLSGSESANSRSASLEPGLSDNFTVSGWIQNVNAQGEARINIQTADETTLISVNGITREIARAIVGNRAQTKLENIADLLEVKAIQNQPGGRRTGNAANASGPTVINQELFLQIVDSLSAETVSEQPGLINMNTASAQVLSWLPGITPELAQAIVSFRSSDGFFSNIGSLLKVPGISREIFKQVAPRISARSETFRIVSEGTLPSSGVRQRLEVVVHIGSRDVNTLAYREDL
jgi:competence ComEA-like helix-hairpin-helix protein